MNTKEINIFEKDVSKYPQMSILVASLHNPAFYFWLKILKMTDIELRYFPVHGFRGLMTRMVMDLSEIKYSEKIVQIRDWPVEKPSKFGCMKQGSKAIKI